MRSIIVGAAALTLLAGSLQAQFTEIEPGVQYAAGTRVGAVELGISLVIPAEWVGVNLPGTELFVLGSNTRPGMVVAMGDEVERDDDKLFLNGYRYFRTTLDRCS